MERDRQAVGRDVHAHRMADSMVPRVYGGSEPGRGDRSRAAGIGAGPRGRARSREVARGDRHARMPRMSTTAPRPPAAALTRAADGAPRPEIAQLPAGLPDVETLFTFMRDAELRFETLRLRLEERTWVARDETVRFYELLLRHPGRVRVTTIRPEDGTPTNHDVWLSDGEMIRTYRAGHRLGTFRPSRPRVAGLDGRDLPGTSRAYHPRTSLPPNSPVETVVHPAGYCQNVVATGACRIVGAEVVNGRGDGDTS